MNVNNTILSGTCALPHLGVVEVQGLDAAHFLHNQLTNDFALLGVGQARFAAFCNAKGRMQASFVGLKLDEQRIVLVGRKDVLPAVTKRLSMFVLRSKVTLLDATDAWAVWGITAVHTQQRSATPWAAEHPDGAHTVGLYPALGQDRWLWLSEQHKKPLDRPITSEENWLFGEIMGGVADIQAANVDAFVPQMLNYESVGGVNFKKGCYPGQEIVARSQFRGTLKRRTYLVQSLEQVSVGQELFSQQDRSQPLGVVVQSAKAPGGGFVALACLQNHAVLNGLQLTTPSGSPLELLPLPYQLLEDI